MNILIVDTINSGNQELMKALRLEELFDYVFETKTVKEAQRIMGTIKIDVILLDIQLPEKSGLDLIFMKDKLLHNPVMIVCSNYRWPQYLKRYDNLLIDYFFDKSSGLVELKLFIKNLVKKKKDNYRLLSQKSNFNYK